MKLATLLVAGWAALAALTPACTPQPLPADPQAEAPGQQDDPAPQDTPDPVDPPKSEDPSGPADDPGQNPGDVPSTPEIGSNKTLVVWYSFTGNSTAIAKALLSHISADALEIQPAEEGLDYAANNYAIGSSLIAAIRANPSSAASYPAIKAVDVAFGDYETILIVTPLWWSQMAAPMQGFLFQNGTKMAGKNIGLIVHAGFPLPERDEDGREEHRPHRYQCQQRHFRRGAGCTAAGSGRQLPLRKSLDPLLAGGPRAGTHGRLV